MPQEISRKFHANLVCFKQHLVCLKKYLPQAKFRLIQAKSRLFHANLVWFKQNLVCFTQNLVWFTQISSGSRKYRVVQAKSRLAHAKSRLPQATSCSEGFSRDQSRYGLRWGRYDRERYVTVQNFLLFPFGAILADKTFFLKPITRKNILQYAFLGASGEFQQCRCLR